MRAYTQCTCDALCEAFSAALAAVKLPSKSRPRFGLIPTPTTQAGRGLPMRAGLDVVHVLRKMSIRCAPPPASVSLRRRRSAAASELRLSILNPPGRPAARPPALKCSARLSHFPSACNDGVGRSRRTG